LRIEALERQDTLDAEMRTFTPPAPQATTDPANGGQRTLIPLDNSTESREFFREELSGTASTRCMTGAVAAPYLRGRNVRAARADSRESSREVTVPVGASSV
jgi:hypothetical protein